MQDSGTFQQSNIFVGFLENHQASTNTILKIARYSVCLLGSINGAKPISKDVVARRGKAKTVR